MSKIIGGTGFIGQNLQNFDLKEESLVYLVSNTNAVKGNHRDELIHLKHLNYTLESLDSKIIYLSTGMVYNGPQSSYIWGKMAAEALIKSHKKPYIILRCGNPYGPYQIRQGIIPALLRAVRDDKPINLWAPLDNYKDYFYVDDLCELIVKATESEHQGVYNAGSGVSRSVEEILEAVTQVTGKEPTFLKSPRATDIYDDSYLAIGKTKDDFNWEPKISLEEGIKKTWEHLLISQ